MLAHLLRMISHVLRCLGHVQVRHVVLICNFLTELICLLLVEVRVPILSLDELLLLLLITKLSSELRIELLLHLPVTMVHRLDIHHRLVIVAKALVYRRRNVLEVLLRRSILVLPALHHGGKLVNTLNRGLVSVWATHLSLSNNRCHVVALHELGA